MSLMIDQIRRDGGTQARAGLNPDTVADYAEQMQDETTVFPPVIVYHDGKDYWLADGFHRVAAWERIGRTEIPVDLRQGDRRTAVLHACAANAAHGLRRTADDKRRAVMTLLSDDEWGQWSDREIARRCVVSPSTVAKYRAEVSGVTVQMDSEPRSYTTKHGTVAQMDTSNIGKTTADPVPAPLPAEASSGRQVGEGTAPPADNQEPVAASSEPVEKIDTPPDPHAAVRKALASLTREGLEDEVIGLREENTDLRKRVEKQRGEIADLKQAVQQLSEGTDIGKALSAKIKELGAVKLARDNALQAAKRMEYRLKQAEARVEELQKAGVAY